MSRDIAVAAHLCYPGPLWRRDPLVTRTVSSVRTLRHARTKKELAAYEREAEKQREKIAKMEASGADEHDVKKQVRDVTSPGRVSADAPPLLAPFRISQRHAECVTLWLEPARRSPSG